MEKTVSIGIHACHTQKLIDQIPFYFIKEKTMRTYILFYILIAAFFNPTSFAAWQFQGGGRVISEQQTTSEGILSAGIIDKPMNLIAPQHLGASANAMAISTSGAVNATLNIMGQHSIYIKNTTPTTQRYKYYYQLCADKTKCFNYNGNIELNPGSVGQNQAASYVTVQFSAPGTYYSEAKTQLVGEQTAYNVNQGFISIYKP